MELENITVNEVTQTQKDMHGMGSLYVDISHKMQYSHTIIYRAKKPNNKVGPKDA